MLNSNDFSKLIAEDIHTVIMATVNEEGNPVTCVIDIMMYEDDKLYFLTAKGKKFYERLKNNENISFSGIKGEDTMSSVSASFSGKTREIGTEKLSEIFEKNIYMSEIYPSEESRKALTVFEVYEGRGEVFDLTQKPIYRKSFSFNNKENIESGYFISDECIGCGECLKVCPTHCIQEGSPFKIIQENCLHCGNCYNACPAEAINKL